MLSAMIVCKSANMAARLPACRYTIYCSLCLWEYMYGSDGVARIPSSVMIFWWLVALASFIITNNCYRTLSAGPRIYGATRELVLLLPTHVRRDEMGWDQKRYTQLI